jgi:ClpP class serine protease
MGIKPTYVTYGQFKGELNSDTPLSPDAQAELQRRVNQAGDSFTRAAARNRGISPAVVAAQFGQGRMFNGQDAIARGMADRIETLDQTVARLAGNPTTSTNGRSSRQRRIAYERERLALRARYN